MGTSDMILDRIEWRNIDVYAQRGIEWPAKPAATKPLSDFYIGLKVFTGDEIVDYWPASKTFILKSGFKVAAADIDMMLEVSKFPENTYIGSNIIVEQWHEHHSVVVFKKATTIIAIGTTKGVLKAPGSNLVGTMGGTIVRLICGNLV